jgi:hypothetical protein
MPILALCEGTSDLLGLLLLLPPKSDRGEIRERGDMTLRRGSPSLPLLAPRCVPLLPDDEDLDLRLDDDEDDVDDDDADGLSELPICAGRANGIMPCSEAARSRTVPEVSRAAAAVAAASALRGDRGAEGDVADTLRVLRAAPAPGDRSPSLGVAGVPLGSETDTDLVCRDVITTRVARG